ncbi:MAG: hypothetical protein GTN80_01340 [Nitrososphaeria archaeon]|nr:hypothetical protein [Nitrososphaeria archaeon]NIQ32288.1 hypothetical protein [Nitrososphaeria archaeon]
MIAPFNNIEVTKEIVEENEQDLSAIIVEPVQRSIPPKNNFLKDLRKLTADKDIMLWSYKMMGLVIPYIGVLIAFVSETFE